MKLNLTAIISCPRHHINNTMKYSFAILACLIGTSYALYPAPNLEPVVVTRTFPEKPSIEYGPPKMIQRIPEKPEEIYGLPIAKAMTTSYGLPTKTFDLDFGKPEIIAEIPSTSYGVPEQKIQVPSTSYGVPLIASKSVTPKLTSYVIVTDTGIPGAGVSAFNVYNIPTRSFEVPKLRIPSTTYGVPSETVSVPVRSYEVPQVRILSTKYGVPSETVSVPVNSYEIPQVRIPSTSYGVPLEPTRQYGLPSVRVPATVYGLP